jgi:hypothetical protein
MKSILYELRKNLNFKFFSVSVLGILLLFMLSDTLVDYSTMRQYMMFELFYGEGKKLAKSNVDGAGILLWKSIASTWFAAFAPLFVSLSYILNNSEERDSGYLKLMVSRAGTLKYTLSKVIAGILSFGIIMMVAYAILGVILGCTFENLSFYNISDDELIYYLPDSSINFILKRMVGSFSAGIAVGIIGMFVSIFLKDKYLVTCLPVLIGYSINRIVAKLTTDAFEITFTDYDLYLKKIKKIDLFNIQEYFDLCYAENIKNYLLLLLAGIALCFVSLFIKTKNRRIKDEWT